MDRQIVNQTTGELSKESLGQRQDLLAILRSLLRAWPHTKTVEADADGPSTLGIYVRALQMAGIGPELLAAAVAQWYVAKDRFPWSPKELIDFCKEGTEERVRYETALEAWGKVDEGMKRRANFKAVHFRNPITARLVDSMGGLAKLSLSEESISDRARFIEAYNSLSQRAKDDLHLQAEFAEHTRRIKEVEARQERDMHSSGPSGDDIDDDVLLQMGYKHENGFWRKPTREENIASGAWRKGEGYGVGREPIVLDHNDPEAVVRAMNALGLKMKYTKAPATLEQELEEPF